MKKKFLYGALAVVLVALNVLAFSTVSSNAAIANSAGPYQDMAYCSAFRLNMACSSSPTAWGCSKHCGKPVRPVAPGGREAY